MGYCHAAPTSGTYRLVDVTDDQMGLHRDGTKWNLDHDVVEARRCVQTSQRRLIMEACVLGMLLRRHLSGQLLFKTVSVAQASLLSSAHIARSSIAPQYIDTALPTEPSDPSADCSLRHDLLKFELSKISAQVLDHAMRVDGAPYSSVLTLHDKL